MKWRKEKCHRIIDESLTNELTQLVKHLFSSPPPHLRPLLHFFCSFFQPPNNQSHSKKKKTVITPALMAFDSKVRKIIIIIIVVVSVVIASHWSKLFRPHKDYFGSQTPFRLFLSSVCAFAWWNNGTAMTFIRLFLYIDDWVWASEHIFLLFFFFFTFLFHSPFYVSEWVFVFAHSLSANDNIINNHQRIKKYNENDSK